MKKSDIAAEYVGRYKNLPSLTLARLIYKENNSAFKDIEDARINVRYVRGKMGKKARNDSASSYGDLHDKKERTKTPYALPETWADPRNVFKLPVGCNKIGVISDAQVPFQDNKAIETAYAWLKAKGVNTIFINGDWVDFYQLSNFQKDPRKRDFNHEYYCILQSLEHMRAIFKDEIIYYNIDANHERRYERYMMLKAPELLGIDPNYEIQELLKLNLFGIKPIRNYDHVLMGKLTVVHGDTIFKGTMSPVSPARTVFTKTNKSTLAGHCHKASEYNTKTIDEEIITCWTTGCLMDLNVEYNRHGNGYVHGFAYVETERDGSFHVENKRIYKGKVL